LRVRAVVRPPESIATSLQVYRRTRRDDTCQTPAFAHICALAGFCLSPDKLHARHANTQQAQKKRNGLPSRAGRFYNLKN